MEGTTTHPALLATTFYHTIYAYDGWDSLNVIMEELKDPIRNMPRAIAISVTCVIVIYTLTNVAYFAVLSKDLILASPAVAVTFGNLTLGVMAWTIPVFVACSISGALNGNTITYSRILFVSARRGHLPRLLSLVQIENNTPVTSLMFLTFLSMWMFVTSDVRVLINYMAFAGNLMHVVCISSFFWFRVKHPDWQRPIKVWIGFPIIYIVLAFFLCVMPVVKQPLEVVAALVILATGIPVYYFLVHREQKPQCLLNAMGTTRRPASTCPCGFSPVVPPGPPWDPGALRDTRRVLRIAPHCPTGRVRATTVRQHTPPCGFSSGSPLGPRVIARHLQQALGPLSTTGLPGGYAADGDVLIIQCMPGRAIKDAPGDL
ncbi:Y+L amino acid transporter 2 [Chionoecetes opilio]|uniref:Y+L amino acid transporter 2 n=1 Tax=Chionoecetes opilio TaxID=41210 RepID=A0A8J4YLM5_CHIOP|nr:Y+L amino acid transporter 2 [Chionoecetes opilio]